MEVELALPSGEKMDTWVSFPEEKPAPGVVVLHEATGMNDDIRRHCDNFAERGYLAAAPNLYATGIRPFCIREIFKQFKSRDGPVFDYIAITREFLEEHDDCTGSVGVVGFCMGGGFALLLAPRGDFDAASVNYGDVPEDIDDLLAGGACPVVASYGEGAGGMADQAEKLEESLRRHDIPHDVEIYADAGHSFLNQHGAVMGAIEGLFGMGWDEDAAEDAWRRIVGFFDDHLRRETARSTSEASSG